jgi:hypothetical protein
MTNIASRGRLSTVHQIFEGTVSGNGDHPFLVVVYLAVLPLHHCPFRSIV